MFCRDARFSRLRDERIARLYSKSLLLSKLFVILNDFWVKKKLRRKSFVSYPITTSSTIISTNPMPKPIVLQLLCCPDEASGISSSITT